MSLIKKEKFNVDYAGLHNKLSKRVYKLNDVADKIEKVAFDIVRFKDNDDLSKIWKIEKFDDGDYIIAMYDENISPVKTSATENKTNIKVASVSTHWQVSVVGDNLNIFYKQEPITKIASSKLGFSEQDLHMAAQYLPKKLAENKSLRLVLLKELPKSTQTVLLERYPELF